MDTKTVQPFPPKEAWLKAAEWGSFMHAGDPGACMYGFDESFRMQSEEHRAQCLAWIDSHCMPGASGEDAADLVRLRAACVAAHLEGATFTAEALVAMLKAGQAVSAHDLDTFTRAYVTCALWSAAGIIRLVMREPMDSKYDWDKIAPATQARMILDCAKFQAENGDTIRAAIDSGKVKLSGDGSDAWSHAGHDFWLTRNGHGAGFWDGDWPKAVGQRLTRAAGRFGSADLYVGGGGLVYQMGAETFPAS